MVPYKLDGIVNIMNSNETAAQGLVEALTGNILPRREARSVWERIPDHKWYLSERLGRDVGMRVAAVDFLENFYEPKAGNTLSIRLDRMFRRLLSVAGSWTRAYLKAKSGVTPI